MNKKPLEPQNKGMNAEQLEQWFRTMSPEQLAQKARETSIATFGNRIYIRGLIEVSSYCRNDCYYCGLRAGNRNAERYRLTREEILDCCRYGYACGFRTFVLQGGEDPGLTDEWVERTVAAIRERYPDCAVTLSLGERSEPVYRRWFAAGANRYLLRHETANAPHYRKLHPPGLSLDQRKECLYALKDIGYQVGAGFMVGSPGQTEETLSEDLAFLMDLQPHMIGIGPFVPHRDTPLRNEPAGTVRQTLEWIARLRLAFPKALLPATTALGTIDPEGREKGILAGANVVMPNLSPVAVRRKYELYDNIICTAEEAAEGLASLKQRMQKIGYEIVVARGDHPEMR